MATINEQIFTRLGAIEQSVAGIQATQEAIQKDIACVPIACTDIASLKTTTDSHERRICGIESMGIKLWIVTFASGLTFIGGLILMALKWIPEAIKQGGK